MEQELRVRVLGGAELAVGGRPLVELASAKAAALVVYLAVTGTGHSRSALAGLLWSDLPEATARANLRLVLTKLRRVLPEHLEVTRQAVALAPGRPVWVDAVEVARAAAGAPDGVVLLAAVRLCRGELLEGFEVPGAPLFDEWLVGRRAAVRADMLAIMDRAVGLAHDRGDAATGVEVARRILELEPLHEEAHRALMWFLATGGQRSAALAQYETCRYVLREELGVEPSAATVALRDEIAGTGGFTELGDRPPTAAGRRDQDEPRLAGRDAGAPAAEREAAVAVAAPDLPRPLTTLVGRERELTRLRELLDDPACRLVTLVGPGGIGKTRLAVEVAASREDRHRDGTVFVSFVGTSPARPEEAADLVVAGLAHALGVSLAVPRDPLELLADHLAGRELLLVLDNLEQLLDAAAGVVAELLRRAPGVQVLATSRRRLGLGVEWLVEVPGLPYPPAEAGSEAAGYEAVQLFEARARLLRPGFLAADAEGAGRVCRLVAGVPLAIELAARWVRSASPAAIADRLAGDLDLLATSAPDVERRHQSLRSVIDWSWQLLTDDERRVLARLSVLRGGFDLDAAAAVAGATLPLLAGLVDQSLINVVEDGRYAMHELVRQYAAERLAGDPANGQTTRERPRPALCGVAARPGRGGRRWGGRPRRRGREPTSGDRLADRSRRCDPAGRPSRAAVAALPAQGLVSRGPSRPDRCPGACWGPGHRAGPLASPARPGVHGAWRGASRPPALRADAGSAGQLDAGIHPRVAGRAGEPGPPAATVAAAAGWCRGTRGGAAHPSRGAGRDLLADGRGVLCARGLVPTAAAGTVRAQPGRGGRTARPDRESPDRRRADHRYRRASPAQPPPGPSRGQRRRPSRRPRHHLLDAAGGRAVLARGRRLDRRGPRPGGRGPVPPCRRPADAWRAIRTAADLAGPGPSFASYTLEAHAGLPEVCLALLERGEPPGVDPAELRATAAAGLRRLRRYARSFPMARPRALVCLGWSHWLQGRHGAAHRAWTRAIREAERLSMPWELANAHHELGRHLAAGQRSPLGLDRTGHLDRARSTFAALGCRTDPDAGRQRP